MKFIRSFRFITPAKSNGRTIVYMHGYGGYLWQATRQLKVLKEAGYTVVALDFIYLLRSKDPQDLLGLMDEVGKFFEDHKLVNNETIIVGISIGGLVGFNLTKRYPELDKLIVITGGDISHLLSKRSLKKQWKLSREELAQRWESVNMYTPYGKLRGKHMIMLLPERDKVIDPNEVREEFVRLSKFNDLKLIETKGGHFRTIISETIVFPKKVLPLIHELENP